MDAIIELCRHCHNVPSPAAQPTNFFLSAGFAGILAVVAAGIAFFASTRNSKRERWWKRAEYALDLVLSGDEGKQLVGIKMLNTLKTRDTGEADFLKAASDLILDPDSAGVTDTDLPAENSPDT